MEKKFPWKRDGAIRARLLHSVRSLMHSFGTYEHKHALHNGTWYLSILLHLERS